MLTKIERICFLLVLFILSSCVEEYWPDVSKYENLLVVSGGITDEDGPYTVSLSVSSSIDFAKYIPYPECQVTIMDDQGASEMLVETEPGVYQTSGKGIHGEAGRSYMLTIKTPEGKNYRSDYSYINEAVGIDSVYGVIEYHQTNDPDVDDVGLQFYLDTDQSYSDSSYFFWEVTSTYEYHSDWTLDYLYEGVFIKFHDPDTFYTCWKTEFIDNIYTRNTIGLSIPKISKFPLHYVTTETKKLSVRYSLLVKQYVVDQNAQEYWGEISDMVADQGTLYSRQPYQVIGNIRNTVDPDEPVLGYFMASSVSSKRIFVNKPINVEFTYPVCYEDTDPRGFAYWPPFYWPIYAYLTDDDRYAHGPDKCFDCTLSGGTLDMPDFWHYE